MVSVSQVVVGVSGTFLGVAAFVAGRRLKTSQALEEISAPAPGEVVRLPEIPAEDLPPAELPPVQSNPDMGDVELKDIPDPKIIVLKAGDTAVLRLPPMPEWGRTFLDTMDVAFAPGGVVWLDHDWLGVEKGDRFPIIRAERWDLQKIRGWKKALYNVGGPAQHKLDRGVVGRSDGYPRDLLIEALPGWGPGDWAQIRVFGQEAEIGTALGDPENVYVEDTGLNRDPGYVVWVMGA